LSMFALARKPHAASGDFNACSGCGLCLLVCPLWRRTHELALTPLGRAKALQFGATAADIAASVRSCSLCAACEPVCPEDIALIDMTLGLRRELLQPEEAQSVRARLDDQATRPMVPATQAAALLLSDAALRARPATLARAIALLGAADKVAPAQDDGADIALALEAGAEIPAQRLERFLQPLRARKAIFFADGLLLRYARRWLPGVNVLGLGEALSTLAAIRGALRASDVYVIEPRAYHADYQRLVGHYDALRAATGCAFNLDLQRIAIPASAPGIPQSPGQDRTDDDVQTRWILQGRKVERIVVESAADAAAFERLGQFPVVHLADLADDETS